MMAMMIVLRCLYSSNFRIKKKKKNITPISLLLVSFGSTIYRTYLVLPIRYILLSETGSVIVCGRMLHDKKTSKHLPCRLFS